ncbi:MAG: fluoride exporter [Thermoplasmata archaeon]|jgi:CrcB protein|nr:fluoride exporter [Thermoplasmata archaeon]
MDWRAVVLVAAGGAAGAVARFGVSTLLATKGFPWATLAVNLAGCLAIGVLMQPGQPGHATRLWAVVGFLGAFTTLSTYGFETFDLWRAGHRGLAVGNMLANGLGGPLLAAVGWRLAR